MKLYFCTVSFIIKKFNIKVQLRMAAEEGMRFIRQYSDEGRQLALRVSVKLHIIIIFKFNIIFLF